MSDVFISLCKTDFKRYKNRMCDSTFRCEQCGKSVPDINRAIHLARCRGGGGLKGENEATPRKAASETGGVDSMPIYSSDDENKTLLLSKVFENQSNVASSSNIAECSSLPSASPAAPIDIDYAVASRADREVVSLLSPSPHLTSSSMIPPGASMSSWPCPRCTLINPDSSNICEGCEFERILAWACPACTFINDINPTDCDMCGTTNPDRKAVSTGANTTRELIVDSDSDDVIIENWRCSRCGTLTSASTSLCENCTQRIDISVNNERRPTTIVSNSARSAFAGAALGAVVGAGASFLQSGSLVEGALRGATWGAVGGLMANSGDTIVDSARSDSFRRPNRRRGASSALSAVQPSQQRQRRGDSDGSSGSPSWAASEIGFPMTTVSGVEFDRPMGRRGRGAARRAGTRPGGGDEDELDAMLHRHIASLLFSSFIIGNTNPGIDIDNMSYDELYERFGGNRPQPASESAIASLPTSLISKGDPPTECSICLEGLCEGEEAQTLPCLHRFHTACSEQWLRQSAKCPICKHNVA